MGEISGVNFFLETQEQPQQHVEPNISQIEKDTSNINHNLENQLSVYEHNADVTPVVIQAQKNLNLWMQRKLMMELIELLVMEWKKCFRNSKEQL